VYYKLADTNMPGIVSGPYDSVRQVADVIAGMHGVAVGRYRTGLPSYDFRLWRPWATP